MFYGEDELKKILQTIKELLTNISKTKILDRYRSMENSCRLCLIKIGDFSDVFRFKANHRISDMIFNICLIKIEENDPYSKQICFNCLHTVYSAYELRILSDRNNQFLKEQNASSGKLFVKIEENADLVKSEPLSALKDNDEYENPSLGIMKTSFQTMINSESSIFSYFCDLCSKKFSTKQGMELHLKKEHLQTNKCVLCLESFCSITNLKQHLRRKHQAKDYLHCNQCNKTFQSLKKIETHQQSHSFCYELSNGAFQCHSCSKRFRCNDQKLNEHINHHKKISHDKAQGITEKKERNDVKRIRDVYESLVCPHCGQIYRTKQILQQHIKRHYETGDKYACPKCPQKFKSWGELYYHSAVHTTERNFICDICNKAFKAKRDLRNHKIRHETKDVKIYQCSFCQLMLKSKYTLNRHILIHTGEKKFICSYCLKAFTQKNELNKHLRIHIGECTYKCDNEGCTEAFRLLAELRLHQQIHYASTNS